MSIAIITGSAGLTGAEAVRHFAKDHTIVGIDNNLRREFFGEEGSTAGMAARLQHEQKSYIHHHADIRNAPGLIAVFTEYGHDIKLIVHTAAQPSHEYAGQHPLTDFGVNVEGTMNMLECMRKFCPEAVFIHCSSAKVYGNRMNGWPLIEYPTRYDFGDSCAIHCGVTESLSIDQSMHCLMGASKAAADLMVQEYGRYYELKTVSVRPNCITGPGHASAELHGFLAYLMKCCMTGRTYTILGFKGKQVRDNIHSYDLVQAFDYLYRTPPPCGEVYNVGGSRYSNCSILEAITIAEKVTGNKMVCKYREEPRRGDQKWYITNNGKFRQAYPGWTLTYDTQRILEDIEAGAVAVK